MDNIQSIAIETFQQNLHYLQNTDQELFQKVNNLSHSIDTDKYTQRYHLEYLSELGQFDLYDTRTDSFIYNKQPDKFNNDALQATDYNDSNSLDILTKE
jgi:Txe/YoeB family toxin of Txe-Axe toxin-antitoxin module